MPKCRSLLKCKERSMESHLQTLKTILKGYFNVLPDKENESEIIASISKGVSFYGANLWVLIFAIFIASLGLNVNSTAVIIGAMLISPLMGPIIGMGLAIGINDIELLRRAMKNYLVATVISVITATFYFLITPLDEAQSELLARTSPTLYDVLIAFFGGMAGIVAICTKGKGNVIPGVAIATALMPPLCTAGYGIATLQPRFIFGAFYLFLINTLFIALSTALVTLILKVPYHRSISTAKQKKINRMIASITVITVIPSVFIGGITVYQSVMKHNISNYLSEEFVFSDAQMVQSNIDLQEKVISVSLVGTPISEESIAGLQQKLENYSLENYTLHITQNTTANHSDSENADKITIAIHEHTISELQEQLTEKESELEALKETVASYEASEATAVDCESLAKNASAIFIKLNACSCGVMTDSRGEYILLTASVTEELSDDERQVIENWLKTETGFQRVKLMV